MNEFWQKAQNDPGNMLSMLSGHVYHPDEGLVELPEFVGTAVEIMQALPLLLPCQPTPLRTGRGEVILTDEHGTRVSIRMVQPITEFMQNVVDHAVSDPASPSGMMEYLADAGWKPSTPPGTPPVKTSDPVVVSPEQERALIAGLEDLLKGQG